jgi:hypothetical protein
MLTQISEITMHSESNNKIFVSYTTRDSHVTKNLLKGIERLFASYGCVFIDCLHNNAINKQYEVIKQLVTSDVFVLLDSPMLKTSPWVILELYLAYSMRKPIIVVSTHYNSPTKVKIQLTKCSSGRTKGARR